MDAKTTLTAMECIEKIYQFSQDSHLRKPLFEAVPEEINFLSVYLNTSEIETILFANAFAVWYNDNTFIRVFKYLGMQEFQVLKYRSEILDLYAKRLLINKDKSGKKINEFDISQKILADVAENKKIKLYVDIPEKSQIITLVDILETFDEMSEQFDDNVISFWDFKDFIDDLLVQFNDRPIFKEIKKLKLDNFEMYFLLDTIWDAVKRGDNDFNTGVQSTADDYYKRKSNSINAFSKIINGETLLIKKSLIELSKEQFVNRTTAKLSDKMVKFLREKENLNIDNVSAENKRLIAHKVIPKRHLFYNDDEKKQISIISEILMPQKFKKLQSRLKNRNMPFGIAVLLHGAPGTGKTESVYQLAKQSGRNIFKVDISETKSMWFGESQKLIKKVFSEYREMSTSEKTAPILLFNEADAVIGKRKSSASSNVADTENAIQNIILEEMENFEGILFATTNLVENMDDAFERRFLFKVKFETPSTEISAKIWKLKLPFLSEKESLKLAESFQFSGGEMENIARKCVMNELLENKNPNYETVLEMCKNEKWGVKSNIIKIGFKCC